jgi:hypothetical protein
VDSKYIQYILHLYKGLTSEKGIITSDRVVVTTECIGQYRKSPVFMLKM